MRKIAQKFASLFYRCYEILNRYAGGGKTVAPYRLKYTPAQGKQRIIHFNGNFVVGGTSQLIVDIIERTSDRYSHHVIVPYHPDPLPYQPLSISAYPLSRLPDLKSYLEQNRPAIVHIHYWVRPVHRYFDFGLWYDAVFRICEELHLKIIQNVNVPTSPYISPGIVHNVFVSDYVRQAFDGNSQTEASVIYPGSDLQFFSSNGELQGNNHTIGMVYRLDRDKLNAESIEVFIEAMRKMPGLRAYIVGGGFYMKDFRKRVRVEGLSDRFTFTGFVPYQELPQHYKNISLIIAPVHDESFGQVTPFAMGMGLPVAGYDTGAMKEILGSGDTLVPYGDRNALSDMIVSLMNDPAKRKDLGNRNKERARKLFDVSGMIKEYDKLYSRNLARYHG